MTDRKMLPNTVAITNDIIQTIVDKCETTASKHYRDQAQRNFLCRSISSVACVIKDLIRHLELVEKFKRLTNSGTPLNETTHSEPCDISKIVRILYDESIHASTVQTFCSNAGEVEQERKQQVINTGTKTDPASG